MYTNQFWIDLLLINELHLNFKINTTNEFYLDLLLPKKILPPILRLPPQSILRLKRIVNEVYIIVQKSRQTILNGCLQILLQIT